MNIGDRIEFVSDGWSWPHYGDRGTIVAIDDPAQFSGGHCLHVEFDANNGRGRYSAPRDRRCICAPRHIDVLKDRHGRVPVQLQDGTTEFVAPDDLEAASAMFDRLLKGGA